MCMTNGTSNKIAYDFEYQIEWKVKSQLYAELVNLVQEWKRRYHSPNRPFLFFAKALSYLTIYDGRGLHPTNERFEGPHAFILEFCNEQPKSFEQIRQGWQGASLRESDERTGIGLLNVLTDLLGKRLLYEERGRYFSLALPVNPHL